jgi:hypothetical protein
LVNVTFERKCAGTVEFPFRYVEQSGGWPADGRTLCSGQKMHRKDIEMKSARAHETRILTVQKRTALGKPHVSRDAAKVARAMVCRRIGMAPSRRRLVLLAFKREAMVSDLTTRQLACNSIGDQQ